MTNELRMKSIEWFKSLYEKDFIIVDTETTGLNTGLDEIIEIGVLSKDGEEIFESKVKPIKPISRGAMEVHGISEEDVVKSPKFYQIYNELRLIMSNNNFVGYSADFDYKMLINNCRMHGCDEINVSEVFDVMNPYSDFWGEWNEYFGNCKWQKLTEACRQQGIKVENSHSAMGDCKLTLELIKKISGLSIE